MTRPRNLATLKPLLIGRLSRVGAGLATLVAASLWGPSELTWLGFMGLMLLGLSFLVGGVVGNPGCEITALPNLVLPSTKRLHCL
ncbi:MAG: hypothetical protein IH939_14565 [Acidobacteria bacterium]|nr:hypothetical protein [Acidobacteriota bacterium]